MIFYNHQLYYNAANGISTFNNYGRIYHDSKSDLNITFPYADYILLTVIVMNTSGIVQGSISVFHMLGSVESFGYPVFDKNNLKNVYININSQNNSAKISFGYQDNSGGHSAYGILTYVTFS